MKETIFKIHSNRVGDVDVFFRLESITPKKEGELSFGFFENGSLYINKPTIETKDGHNTYCVEEHTIIDNDVLNLLEEREAYRLNKDYEKADLIQKALKTLNIQITNENNKLIVKSK